MFAAEVLDDAELDAEESFDDGVLAASFDDESELEEFEELTVLEVDDRESVA
ncbi:hypothetical protein [Brevibacterium atlanticum]|uniref:hypothetical protein n=1 Tax=Brevibacterium atlanticum TaxID=2697563 RepID=UPI002B1BD392|nr:hypothetical protein [Brevibacterium atlanticum]